jgi:hypothetical protein
VEGARLGARRDFVQRGGQGAQRGHRVGQGILAEDGGEPGGRLGVRRADAADRGAAGGIVTNNELTTILSD